MNRFISKRLVFALAILSLSAPGLVSAAPVVFEASGATPADIQATVDAYRALLGPLNPNVPGSFQSGRREINWDGVPDAFAAPNNLPPGFFNVNSPRGAVFFTPGTGFQVSADDSNPTNTPVRFGNLHPVLPQLFSTFSPQRLFIALDSTITETFFFVPGSPKGATVSGFGAVFTDVNSGSSTTIEYFDVKGNLLFKGNVLPGTTSRGSLSFLGAAFDAGERVFAVRITSGDRNPDAPAHDVVAMDDFIYAEPQATN
ncbi:MAG TPA: hypothetical protein VGQ67_09435 [Candidatus Polarisedimenticolia bacterium]|nr:hypothetical protein [Candidatus Polarisedimenticolia bacterium]